jgi:hypothetical protein
MRPTTSACVKVCYPDAATAHAVAEAVRKHIKRGKQTRAYYCRHCDAYHLTGERERPA